MHNLDRSMFEVGEHEALTHRSPDSEQEQEDFLGILGSLIGETSETGETNETEQTGETWELAHEGTSGELQELELASELLEIRDEAELDRFLGDLITRATGAASRFAASPTGQALGGVLKQATKQALPIVGRGVAGWLSPSYAGTGERVGQAAGDLLGLELEGLSGEDREFEIARALIRFLLAACRNAAAAAAEPAADPADVVRSAVVAAARRHAPGLLSARVTATPTSPRASQRSTSQTSRPQARPTQARPTPAGPTPAPTASEPQQHSGRWERHGRTIVIHGI